MRILNNDEIQMTQGGHIGFFLLELPHILMGLREFINYLADRSIHGCQNIEPSDYVTEFICNLVKPS